MKRSNNKIVVSIVGARPQFIKLAALASRLSSVCRHKIIHTGQHFDSRMSSSFFRQLRIPRVTRNLGISGGSHGQMTARMLTALESLFLKIRPAMVLVYGDTNSTLAGALAAAKLGIPIGHIEAGLRSFVDSMPEEINRRVADQLSQLYFCPTPLAVKNLRREGLSQGLIHTGDLMYELIYDCAKAVRANGSLLRRHQLSPKEFVYLTVHRASNVDSRENLEQVIELLAQINQPILLPIHPRTRRRLRQFKLTATLNRLRHVTKVEPLGYIDSLSAARNASHVLTDSGGLQKEAIFLGTPVLTLRDETEWTETLRMGNRLVGLNASRIRRALARPVKVGKVDWRVDGQRPSQRILSAVAASLRR